MSTTTNLRWQWRRRGHETWQDCRSLDDARNRADDVRFDVRPVPARAADVPEADAPASVSGNEGNPARATRADRAEAELADLRKVDDAMVERVREALNKSGAYYSLRTIRVVLTAALTLERDPSEPRQVDRADEAVAEMRERCAKLVEEGETRRRGFTYAARAIRTLPLPNNPVQGDGAQAGQRVQLSRLGPADESERDAVRVLAETLVSIRDHEHATAAIIEEAVDALNEPCVIHALKAADTQHKHWRVSAEELTSFISRTEMLGADVPPTHTELYRTALDLRDARRATQPDAVAIVERLRDKWDNAETFNHVRVIAADEILAALRAAPAQAQEPPR